MQEMQPLFTLGPASVTAYSLMMVLAAALGAVLTIVLAGRSLGTDKAVSLSLSGVLGAVLGGHIVYVLCMFNYFDSGLTLLYKPWLGGYTLYGAVIGGLIALMIEARVSKESFLKLTDLAAPGAMLAIMIGRAAEMFTDQGLGEYVDEEALQWFPVAVPDMYGDFRMPVFAWEAMAALVILVVLLVLMNKKPRTGNVTGTALTLLGTSQIFLEQVRKDDYLRFGFVRFTQLAAIILIACVMAVQLFPVFKTKRQTLWTWLRTALLLAGVLVVIFIEFAFEKPQFLPILRVCIGLMGALCAISVFTQARKGALTTIVSAFLAVLTVAILVPLHMALDWENDLLLAVMALALGGIAVAVLKGERK